VDTVRAHVPHARTYAGRSGAHGVRRELRHAPRVFRVVHVEDVPVARVDQIEVCGTAEVVAM
jgi:hypothetical protein